VISLTPCCAILSNGNGLQRFDTVAQPLVMFDGT
jgi:hypothetical protein